MLRSWMYHLVFLFLLAHWSWALDTTRHKYQASRSIKTRFHHSSLWDGLDYPQQRRRLENDRSQLQAPPTRDAQDPEEAPDEEAPRVAEGPQDSRRVPAPAPSGTQRRRQKSSARTPVTEPPEVAEVHKPWQLLRAVADGAKHIVIRAHLDLTNLGRPTSSGVSDSASGALPPNVTELTLGRLSSSTKSIRGDCESAEVPLRVAGVPLMERKRRQCVVVADRTLLEVDAGVWIDGVYIRMRRREDEPEWDAAISVADGASLWLTASTVQGSGGTLEECSSCGVALQGRMLALQCTFADLVGDNIIAAWSSTLYAVSLVDTSFLRNALAPSPAPEDSFHASEALVVAGVRSEARLLVRMESTVLSDNTRRGLPLTPAPANESGAVESSREADTKPAFAAEDEDVRFFSSGGEAVWYAHESVAAEMRGIEKVPSRSQFLTLEHKWFVKVVEEAPDIPGRKLEPKDDDEDDGGMFKLPKWGNYAIYGGAAFLVLIFCLAVACLARRSSSPLPKNLAPPESDSSSPIAGSSSPASDSDVKVPLHCPKCKSECKTLTTIHSQ